MNDQTCNYQYDLAIIGGGPGGYEAHWRPPAWA